MVVFTVRPDHWLTADFATTLVAGGLARLG